MSSPSDASTSSASHRNACSPCGVVMGLPVEDAVLNMSRNSQQQNSREACFPSASKTPRQIKAHDMATILGQLESLNEGQTSLQAAFVAFAEEQKRMRSALQEFQEGGSWGGPAPSRRRKTGLSLMKNLEVEEAGVTQETLEESTASWPGNGTVSADQGSVSPEISTEKGPHELPGRSMMRRSLNGIQKALPLPVPPSLKKMNTTLEEGFSQGMSTVKTELADMKAIADMNPFDDHNFAEMPPPTGKLGKFVISHNFDSFCAAVLIANMFFMGVQVEYAFKPTTPAIIRLIDLVFMSFFLVELAVRMLGLGCARFWCDPDARMWNIFDVVIVTLSTTSQLMDEANVDVPNMSVFRLIRLVKIIRMMRVIMVLRFFEDLRILLAAIGGTLKTTSLALLLIVVIIYVFAIAIGQLVADHLRENKHVSSPENMQFYFGGLWPTVFSLYMSITGGVDWQDVAVPLFDVGQFAVMLFLAYSSLMILCVMNVLVGMFCQCALDTTAQDRENVIKIQLQEKHRFVKTLKNLFADWDESGNGKCSLQEFINHVTDAKTQALLRSLGIEGRDAVALFELLDADGSGEVDLNEFVAGCMNLRGPAKAVHVEQVNTNNRNILQRAEALEDKMDKILKQVLPAGTYDDTFS